MKKLLFGMLFATIAFGTNTAFADGWPPSVVGSWSVLAATTTFTLNITSQGATGDCQSIAGNIISGQTIAGFYCPHSGRIHFLLSTPGGAYQDYDANLSQVGPTLHMGGVFGSDFPYVGQNNFLGQYNFQASK